ncbi:MAG: hypothetical protein R6W67_12395 [Bacteroidales bacterium]
MKKFTLILALACILAACEKWNGPVKTGNPNTDFSTHILEGYFVTAIGFNSKGNAWIGTFKQGLIKYSNGTITVYNPSNSAMPAEFIAWDLKVDSHDNIWLGGEGLLKYDGQDFTLYNTSNSPMPEDFVSSISIDSKDNIWFTSCRFRQGGIVRYDGSNFTVYTPDNSSLPVNFVQSIEVDHDDNIWLALGETVTHASVIRISGNKWKNYSADDLGFTPYYFGNIKVNSRNEICGAIDYSLSSLGVNSGPQVFVFDGKNTRQLSFDDHTRIKSLSIDHEDNIWCSAYGGFAVYNGKDWIVDNTTFTHSGVFTIEQAPDKRIWIGTGDGVYINK